MKWFSFLGVMLTLLISCTLTLTFNIHLAEATQTIYIRADGSVDPSTAPIRNIGNVSYTFTSNINESIVVERDNIVIDGACYTLQGLGSGRGIDLTGRSNITIKSIKVAQFYYGIYLEGSSNITLLGNTVTTCEWDGVFLSNSVNNVLYDNIFSSNKRYGTMLSQSGNNRIFHNSFVCNVLNQTRLFESFNNIWDDSYPSGGNYWSDYKGTDLFHGPLQNETGGDDIGDTAYVIDEYNTDNYPLMMPWEKNPPLTSHDYYGSWQTADFTINLTAVDDLSGVAETYYKINNDPTRNVTANGQPLITTEGANNTLEFWSVDKADNEELPHKILTEIRLDKTYPKIETPSRMPEGDVLPDQPVKVSVNVTDAVSEVKNVTLYYTVNNGTWEEPKPMNINTATSLYETTIPAQPAHTWVRFKIVAHDHAGNNATRDGTESHCIYQVIPEFPSAIIPPLFTVLSITTVAAAKRKSPRKLRN